MLSQNKNIKKNKKRKFEIEREMPLLPQDIFFLVFSWIDIVDRFSNLSLVSKSWKNIALHFSKLDHNCITKCNFLRPQIKLLQKAWNSTQLSSHFFRLQNIKNLIQIGGSDCFRNLESICPLLLLQLCDLLKWKKEEELDIPARMPFYFAFKVLAERSSSSIGKEKEKEKEKENFINKNEIQIPLHSLTLGSRFFRSLLRSYTRQSQNQPCFQFPGLISFTFPYLKSPTIQKYGDLRDLEKEIEERGD